MKRNLFSLVFIALLAFVSSCKKGDDGPPGTANVKYSEWFTASTWQKDTIFGAWGFNHVKDAPGITQQILDNGTLLTFGKLKGYNPAVWKTDEVGQLPITITYHQGGVTNDTWSATGAPGKLKIRFINDRNIYTSIANTHQFRYIIIPGGLPAGRGVSLNYEDICRMYNIPE
jgi:hypothetical protein